MSGTKYLLDTNYILGVLKCQPEIQADIALRALTIGQCAYSSVTRMELLGFPGITRTRTKLAASSSCTTATLPRRTPNWAGNRPPALQALVKEKSQSDYCAAKRDALVKMAGFKAYDHHE